jgi:hypothetical protein
MAETIIDLTDPALDVAPVPQSTDVEVCELTLANPIAETDILTMHVRETFGDKRPVGKLTLKDGNFALDVAANRVSVRLTEQTSKWYSGSREVFTEASRIRALTGTLLHESAAGVSYPWSGLLHIRFLFALSWTRG